MASRRLRVRHLAVTLLLIPAGCSDPLNLGDGLGFDPAPPSLREIDPVEPTDLSSAPPTPLDEIELTLERPVGPPAPPRIVPLRIEDVRASAFDHNLDLKVSLVAPAIAALSVDEAEAAFEAAFTASGLVSRTDAPVALETEGSQVEFRSIDTGVRLPLRTGGTASVTFPLSRTSTNNPFSLIDPSYTADLRFSISQPLLRGAGNRTNTHAIRVARLQEGISAAQTKLEAIRILANADRAYWILYATRRELDVRIEEYELALEQLERAHRRVNAGDVAEIEVTRAQSGVAQRVEAIIIAENAVLRSERNLKRIMNREDLPMDGIDGIGLETAPDPVGLELDPQALAADALERRMEMLELELQLAIDTSTIDLERNARLPLVTLDYAYTINGLGATRNDALDQLPDHSFEDWSLALRAEVPIGNEAAKARVSQAILRRLQRLATREQRTAAIRQEVFDAVDAVREAWQRILAARQDAVLAGRTFDGEQRQFNAGVRTSTDVLDAATRLSDARSREIRAVTDYQIAQIDLAFATGTLLGYGRVRWDEPERP